MIKKGFMILFFIFFFVSAVFAINPADFVPADIDFALDLSYPKAIMEMTGFEDAILAELTDLEFLNTPLDNARVMLFGKFGLSDLLLSELDLYGIYDFEDVLGSPELLLSLSTMPIGILTNLINMDFIFNFLEGEFMASAHENDVYFISETIEKAGYETKHLKIRYYGDGPNVFLDLFFVQLGEDYYLFTSDENLLDKSLNSAIDETIRLKALQSKNDSESFLNIVNNGLNYSWLLMRMMDILDGKPLSDRLSAGIKDDAIFVDMMIEMTYPGEGSKEILEKTKTDMEHYKYLPDFEDIKLYTSLPQTGLSMGSFMNIFSEITGEYGFDYHLEEVLKLPGSLGPEVERYDMYLVGSDMIPYLLMKVEDAPFIFNNYVKDNWLEVETAETVSFALMDHLYNIDNLYMAYDSRFNYIEVHYLSEENRNRLENGILYFTDEMAKEKETAHHIPENLWGMFMYEDMLSLVMDYDESANFQISMTLSLEEIFEQLAMSQLYEQMDEIAAFYYDMNYAIQDEIYYTAEEVVDLGALLKNSYMFDYYDEELIESFKFSTGEREDAYVYYIYYDGSLPEGITSQDFANRLSNDIYEENVEIVVKSGKVVMEIYQAK